ncbi:endo-1,4-beta-xylanase [Haloferula luteola]|uniref:Beta-xylanase n=1 Tax=Haloferula luteola TaxID=595692 RepID=A0A840V3D7_9BACT|nr:endo-1,4-beta-xylanase [Haloferula luteola]MBB5351556.1 endo-1,4-beta-xylanase [Haloferula luteola]
MKRLLGFLLLPLLGRAEPTLRESFEKDFLVGVALPSSTVDGREVDAATVAGSQFSALTPENDMKWASLHPHPERYDFTRGDAYVHFAEQHHMKLIGHTLVWHSQTPEWVFQGAEGQPADRELLLARMKDHIDTVVGHFRGKVHGWDVVNEALSDSPGEDLRDSPWRRIIGDDFIQQAFHFAHAADPTAQLYYNDYGLAQPEKRARAVRLLQRLIDQDVPISAVGMQGHYSLSWPDPAEVEKSIIAFHQLGLKVMITELDIDVLPSRGASGIADIARTEASDPALNPFADTLPATVSQQLADRYTSLFQVFLRHHHAISRVTFWGLHDGRSWLNDFPIRGRTNYPLLFDRSLQPKPAFEAILRIGSTPR